MSEFTKFGLLVKVLCDSGSVIDKGLYSFKTLMKIHISVVLVLVIHPYSSYPTDLILLVPNDIVSLLLNVPSIIINGLNTIDAVNIDSLGCCLKGRIYALRSVN